MSAKEFFRKIFFPKFGMAYVIRVVIVAIAAFVFFRYFCRPMILDGASMEPNYHSGTLNFCWTPAYAFRELKHGDVIVLKYAGDKVMILKRVIALPGDIVEFRDGVLFLNYVPQEEPYVRYDRARWNLPPRRVDEGKVYVVGDNRSMPMEQHIFGEIDRNRVMGSLLL